MRILHLIPSLVGGGAERQLAHTAHALSRRGLEIHVGFVHGGENLARLEASDVRLHEIECSGNHDPRILLRVIRLIGATRPQIVHTWLLQMDVFGGLAARISRTPWVLSERSSPTMYESGWKFALRERVGRHATAVVANSEAGLTHWNARPRRTFDCVIRNAIPFEELDAAAHQSQVLEGIGEHDAIVLVAGRYSSEKNLEFLLDAIDHVLVRFTDAQAVFFGEGPSKDELTARKHSLPSGDRIHICGFTENLAYWMSKAAVYVSASRFEGTPNTVLEAVACGCPVIVSDIPAHREILDTESAAFVPLDSVDALVSALASKLMYRETAKRQAMQLRSRFLPWTPDGIAEQYEKLYETIVAGASR